MSIEDASDMEEKKVKIIYILGYERSGSTILHNLIGQTKSYFSVGELRYIWQRGIDNRPCGCGEAFNDCPFWEDIFDRHNPHQQHIRESFFPFALLFSFIPSIKRRIANHTEYLKTLYTKTYEKSDAAYIVDHSKSVMHLKLLSSIKNFEVKTIHIVRDPRGIEYSLHKRKLNGHKGYRNHSVYKNLLKIDLINLMSNRYMKKYSNLTHSVRYEDLIRRPGDCLDELSKHLEVNIDTSMVDGDEVTLEKTHSVGGSPSRHNTGKIKLRLDDKWKQLLPKRSRWLLESFSYTYKRWYK